MRNDNNKHVGWANTFNHPDLIDFSNLTITPANPNQYWLDGQWRDFEKSDAKIRVKIWGPLIWPAHREGLYAAQGPVLKNEHGVFPIRYPALTKLRPPPPAHPLNKTHPLATSPAT